MTAFSKVEQMRVFSDNLGIILHNIWYDGEISKIIP